MGLLDKATTKALQDILEKLLKLNGTPQGRTPVPLQENEIMRVIELTTHEFRRNSCAMIDLEAPVTICGDTHGQFNDVIRLFDTVGWPPRTRYLFLGDYVDRGKQSIETMILMFIFKLRYPDDFYILRGNHETPSICRIYGFYDECKRRYNLHVWRRFMVAFSHMPICALVSSKIFCMHGGLSPSITSLDQLRQAKLPFEIPDSTSLVSDVLWCDPDPSVTGFQLSRRGVGYIFGVDTVHEYCKKLNIDLIVRAHQVVENGYEFFADYKLVTIFSAPHYCGEFDNSAGVLIVDDSLLCHVRQLKPCR